MSNAINNFNLVPPDELFSKQKNSPKIAQPEIVTTKKPSFSNDNFTENLTNKKANTPKIANISLFGLGEKLQGLKGIKVDQIKLGDFGLKINNTSSLNLPPRKNNAVSGSQFIESTKGLPRDVREKMILNEVLNGNVPDFARNFKEITLSTTDSTGQKHTGKVQVLPDYVAIGSNNDFIRVPMDPMTAQKIANKTGTMLPTRKMVNDIYKQASAKLSPQPLPAGATMMSSEYYQKHQSMVENQRTSKGYNLGDLTSGHKKDLVITNLLDSNPKKVAIYGWHQNNGKAIQPLSTIHEDTYADYSHGVRLVNQTMILDGKKVKVEDVLKNPELSKMLSDEGVINNTKIRIRN
ncbi:MAG: hypothetical protein U0457_09755 [Candidatus Sericytochromatia bacterium]